MKRGQTWDVLESVLGLITYERDPLPDHWGKGRFLLERHDEDNYAVLYVFTYNVNTYHPEDMRLTRHEFVVPVATYNGDTWVRWVYDRVQAIEAHETSEWFFVSGNRLFAPHHGNGEDPYAQWYASYPEKKTKAPGDA